MMADTDVSDYTHAAPVYRAAAWPGVLPLPAGQKTPPPRGYTGDPGTWPTADDYTRWDGEYANGNIALRLPAGVIGIDADLYKPEHAAAWITFTAGLPELPLTAMSTSRHDGSGIRLYRVPDDARFRGKFAWGEVIQRHHRYLIAPPSIHPETGKPYRWLTTDGELLEAEDGGFYVPRIGDLPELPPEWVTALQTPPTAAEIAEEHVIGKAALTRRHIDYTDWAPSVHKTVERALGGMTRGSRHDTMVAAAANLARAAKSEFNGAEDAWQTVRAAFIDAVDPDREGVKEADTAWETACALVRATPSTVPDKDARIAEYRQDGDNALREMAGPKANGQEPRTEPEPPKADESILLPAPVDWHALWLRECNNEWLVEDVWPLGRQLHVFAARKTGKSLVSLWMAGNIAIGRDPFNGTPRTPMHVTYLDHEMTEDDLLERAEGMGFAPDQLANLHYYLLPSMPPLDTAGGGARLMQLIERDESQAVVIDTLSRVVQGEENSNDTYQNFYAYTGRPLKRAGVSMMRLDHEGHEAGRSRGASSKADDVDVIWRLQNTDDGKAFVRSAARIAWVPERVDLIERTEPLSFSTGMPSWPAGTKDKALELDSIGAPIDVSKRKARELLKEAHIEAGRDTVLTKAIAYRKTRVRDDPFAVSKPVDNHPQSGSQTPGTTPFGTTPEPHLGTETHHASDLREPPREPPGTSTRG
jgi:hypothetical protein